MALLGGGNSAPSGDVHMDLDDVFQEAFEELRQRGLVMESDRSLPSVAGLVNGGPVPGSWWAHPLSHEIYMVCQRLTHHPDVTVVKLINEKVTYVHRRLWPNLYSIGTGREPWQYEGLPAAAKALFEKVCDRGVLRLDDLGKSRSLKELGKDARSIEVRLLVLAVDIHTESGAHVKRLETWQHWAGPAEFRPLAPLNPADARAEVDRIAAGLLEEFGTITSLPWHRPMKHRDRLIRVSKHRGASPYHGVPPKDRA